MNITTIYLLSIFWLTALTPTLHGIIYYSINIEYAFYFKAIVHLSYIFGILFFSKYIIHDRKIHLLLLIALLMIIVDFFQHGFNVDTLWNYLHGIKVYFIPLIYLFIMHNLIKTDDSFAAHLQQHIVYLFFITLFISLFEIFSARLYPSNKVIQYWMQLSQCIPPEFYGRPNGIVQDSHGAAFILAIAAIYYFIKRKVLTSALFTSAVILSAIKTWWIGMTFILIIYYLFNLKNKSILKNLLSIVSVQIVVFTLSSSLNNYMTNLNPASPSEAKTMYELYTNINNYSLISLYPHGFIFDDIYLSDAYSLFILYQLGIFIGLIYFFLLYSDFTFNKQYWPIILFSVFPMIHTNPLNYIFIMFIYGYFIYYTPTKRSVENVTKK